MLSVGLSDIQAQVFAEKYALRDADGRLLEHSPEEMWRRVAREIASVEKEEVRKEWEENFYWLLSGFRFIPGGRILFGAGQRGRGRRVTLLNCYVIPIKEDSIEGIFEWCKEAARTYSYGGGVGTDISILRPKGAPVHNAALQSTGSVSFMNVMSETTGTIGQSGRRGALMITIRVDHPDVFDFIKVKRDLKSVRYANISVRVTDEFMRAVEEDREFTLWYENEVVGRLERKIRARELWRELVQSARDWAEPGLIFWDTVKRGSPSEYNGMEVVTTNPCSEQPLQPYGACDLGSINLSAFVVDKFTEGARVDWEGLERAVRYAVRFLDDVLDNNADLHPLPEQGEASLKSRRIGLGVTGLADMLAKLRIRYDSEEAFDFIDEFFNRFKCVAYDASVELAKEKGAFPLFDAEKHLSMPFIRALPVELREKIARFGLRNVAILTVPPVGSGSVLAGVSSGIEPIFAFSYTRRSESLSKKEFKVYHPLVEEYMRRFNLKSEAEVPPYFVEAHRINPEFRVKMQGTIQKHIDSAISSTVNLPSDITVEEVEKIYMLAWKSGCKGITVYREGSREDILKRSVESRTRDAGSRTLDVGSGSRDADGGGLGSGGGKREAEAYGVAAAEWGRPKVLEGRTVKLRLPQGSLYVTVNTDVDGRPVEVFVTLGKSGTDDKAYTEALGRLVSLYLQHGGSAAEVVDTLKGIHGRNSAWDSGVHILSVPDGVAHALQLVCGKQNPGSGMRKAGSRLRDAGSGSRDADGGGLVAGFGLRIAGGGSQPVDSGLNPSDGAGGRPLGLEVCPSCGEETYASENGCWKCFSCGHSQCM